MEPGELDERIIRVRSPLTTRKLKFAPLTRPSLSSLLIAVPMYIYICRVGPKTAGMSDPRPARVRAFVYHLTKQRILSDETVMVAAELSALSDDIGRCKSQCAVCGAAGELRSCHGCGFVKYCGRECQRAGWPAHQLVCRTLNADREISKAVAATNLVRRASHAVLDSYSARTPLRPLAGIVSRLRGDGHVKAYDAAVHLSFLLGSCDLVTAEKRGALYGEIAASGCIPLLVSSLAVGGLRACRAIDLLHRLLEWDPALYAEDAIMASGALPLLVSAIALPSQHADLGSISSLRAAAIGSADLLCALAWQEAQRPVIIDAGAIAVLLSHLKLSLQASSWSPLWPNVDQQRVVATVTTAKALAYLCSTDAAAAEEVAAAGFADAELSRLSRLRPPMLPFRTIRQFFTWLFNLLVHWMVVAGLTVVYSLHYFGLIEYQGRV